MEGLRYGRLTVQSEAGRYLHKVLWLCTCACGKSVVVVGGSLRNSLTTSCGCYHTEQVSARFTKHGCINWPEYRTWKAMKERCCRPAHVGYKYYGARGIQVCDRWLHSFENFLADIGQKPSPRHTLDRINTEGNYEPGNCRWATSSEQRRNQRRYKLAHPD